MECLGSKHHLSTSEESDSTILLEFPSVNLFASRIAVEQDFHANV